ncbi:MAG: hypothetical protein ACFB0G_11255 [Leptolyngbyaceae cyanobacterium]
MASLTRTVYGPNGQAVETLTGSDGSVTERLLVAQESRFEAQMESNAQPPPVVWGGRGRIRQIGGNGTYRPRGVQANGGFGAGDPVQVNDGLVSATPRAGNNREMEAHIAATEMAIYDLAGSLPGQYGNGDPNNETVQDIKDVLPRYINDTYYDLSSGTLFLWDSANEEWEPLRQLFQGFTGNPNDQSGAAVPVYLDGAIAINAVGAKFTGETTNGTWQGEIEDLHGYIEAVEDKTYPIVFSSSYAFKVALIITSGASVVTPSVEIGQTVPVAGNLDFVITDATGQGMSFTIKKERV